MKQILALPILYYLRFFAQAQIFKLKLLNPKLKIIGVTGSAGKTSTIAAIEAVLSPKFKVKTTAGSNSESGIPLSLLNIPITGYTPIDWLRYLLLVPLKLFTYHPHLDILIIEMGIDSPKSPQNMDYLLSIVKPDIGIFLNVTSVHLMNFASLNQIALEKSKLVNSIPVAIANLSDPLVNQYTHNPSVIPMTPLKIKIKNQPLPDIYYSSFGAAAAVAKLFNLSQQSTIDHLQSNFHLPPGRSSILPALNHSLIIDSSYNSSPLATSEMLKFLKTFTSPRLAILGDMRELGSATKDEHLKLYQLAIKSADQIISVGPETQKYFGGEATKFLYWWQALEYIKQHLPAHSTILIKGSQNTIYLEELVKGLLLKKSDSKKLCRQSPYWLTIKNNFHRSTP